MVIWETDTGRAVCGSPAAQDSALSVKWLHRRNDRFVTAGNFHLRVWQVDVSIPKASEREGERGKRDRERQREREREKERRDGKRDGLKQAFWFCWPGLLAYRFVKHTTTQQNTQ